MSNVTNVFIIVDVPSYDDSDLPIELFDKLPFVSDNQKFGVMDNDDWVGGYKHLEVDVIGAAFNYAKDEEIAPWFHSLNWRKGLEVLLIISPQEGGFIIERRI